jgi:microcystin-dependent protein
VAQPYVGEIRMFAGNFAPAGWMFCEGQLLPISENETLFQLIGTTYGGDGESTFALPDMRGRLPIHQGAGPSGTTYILAETGGVESVTLTTPQIAAHSHPLIATDSPATASVPGNNLTASASKRYYVSPSTTAPMAAATMSPTGGSQPHNNFQPYLCVNYIISLFGIFPSQT